MPNIRVRGCAGSRRNILVPAGPPASPRISRTVDGRSTCDVGAVEMVIGPVRFGGLINITAFAVDAIDGSRTVEGPGTSERLSLRPLNPSGAKSVPWSDETIIRLES